MELGPELVPKSVLRLRQHGIDEQHSDTVDCFDEIVVIHGKVCARRIHLQKTKAGLAGSAVYYRDARSGMVWTVLLLEAVRVH